MRFLLVVLLAACAPVATRAEPEDLLSLYGNTLLAIAGDTVYGATSGTVWRLPKGKAEADTLVMGTGQISDIMVDSSGLGFTLAPLSEAGTTLKRAGLDGANPVTLASNVIRGSVRQDADNYYWLDDVAMPKALMKVKKTGGAATKLADVGEPKSEITVDDTHVYFVDFTAPPTIKRVAKAGGAVETVRINTLPAALQNDDTSIYYLNKDPMTGYTRILQLAKSGGEPVEKVQDADRFFVEASYLYFSTQVTTPKKHQLSRIAKTGKLLDVLVNDTAATASLQIQATGTHVYWADGKLLTRLALP